jgi:YVTN family beta-propeller protein
MMKFLLCFVYITFILFQSTYSQNKAINEPYRIFLPNGWSLTPVGKSLPLGDLPLNIAVSKSKKIMAVTNNGESTQTIQLIDVANEKILDSVIIPKSWYGLKFSSDNKTLYASGGNDNRILVYNIIKKHLILSDFIILGKPWPEKISPAGIDIDDDTHLLYVVTKDNNSLYILDLLTKKIIDKIALPDAAYTCMLSSNKGKLYISCWGCDKIILVDTHKRIITNAISVGDNPNEIILTKNNKYLYVSNANDNSVSVIDLNTNKVIETLNAALYPNSPSGSTSNGLALSKDEKTLYIANADNNCLALFDVSNPGNAKSKGFIPTGWYPTNVKVINNKIYVSNGKGFSSKANPNGPNPFKREISYQNGIKINSAEIEYIANLFKGAMSIIPIPDEKTLKFYSKLVYENTPYSKEKETQTSGIVGNPVPSKVGEISPIKYVFYIIKENRTYDQVLGDMKEGNGDSSLVLFGNHITPNEHAIAKQFVLIDNFYVDGEVSADGHNWSMGAYATDYLEKTWPTSYGHRGGTYDAEGNRAVANNKNGFIWDMCKRNNVTYRTYGEFADNYKPNIPVLKNHFCPYYTSWNQSVPDTTRFRQWKRDFDSLLAINAVPQLNTLRFINDHTEGIRKGRPTPFADVADNDLATGMFVDYLSHSSIWNESVVFIVEDDAQNGPDHVDAHRSTAFVAGGMVKKSLVDHSMYSTSSILRTIELILGMPPMTQYDAAAEPLWRCFSDSAIHPPFNTVPCEVDLHEKNTALNQWQKLSETFDFSAEDRVPDTEMNQILWYGLKGENIAMPNPVRAAFLRLTSEKGND